MTHLAAPQVHGPAATSGGKAITLQFNNNTLLPLLLGDHDRHLVRIEQALGVRLSCRGNRVAIAGEAARVDVVQGVLQGLWRRLERGESVGRTEIETAIRLAEAESDSRLPLSDLPAIRTRRGAVAARSPGQAVYMEALAAHEMVFGVGPAGTGKTYLAVAQAVAMLQAGKVDRIVLSRPAVEAGERLGFLPGDLKEKIDPYLRPLYDALHDMMPADQVIRRMTNGEIEVAPLAFMRGRTLAHCYAILDEAQNTTAMQMKMFPDSYGRRHAHGHHRRSQPRSICHQVCVPACVTPSKPLKASLESASLASSSGMWCGILWSRASSAPMINAKQPSVRLGESGLNRASEAAMEPPSIRSRRSVRREAATLLPHESNTSSISRRIAPP